MNVHLYTTFRGDQGAERLRCLGGGGRSPRRDQVAGWRSLYGTSTGVARAWSTATSRRVIISCCGRHGPSSTRGPPAACWTLPDRIPGPRTVPVRSQPRSTLGRDSGELVPNII